MALYKIYTENGGKKNFGSSLWGRASGTVFVPERFNRGNCKKTGFYRNKSLQTDSSGTLIGRKSDQTAFVPLERGS